MAPDLGFAFNVITPTGTKGLPAAAGHGHMNPTRSIAESAAGAGTRPSGSALLTEIAADLAAGGDLRELLVRFLEPIVQLAGAQAGAVRVLSEAGDRLHLVGDIGLPGALCTAEQSVDRHCGFCGDASDSQRVVWADDLAACSRHTAGRFFAQPGRRMLVVPMPYRGHLLGICNLFFDRGAVPPPEVGALLKSVGELLGLALHNARLEAENLRASVLHERQAMAAEMHDSVAQTLSFVKMRLPLLQDALQSHDDARSARYLDDVRQAVGEAHGSLREIITDLRTRIDPRGLGPALEALAARQRERTGIALKVLNRLPTLSLGPERDAELFHVVREALVNIERHAGARRAWLRLRPARVGIEISIEDDGVGPPLASVQNARSGHHGLVIMQERAHRLGAALTVSARPGGGTRVRLRLAAPRSAQG
jgi:two-component system, NarL family, nitrate/nitrite sensor histidine kinase NarX